MAKLQKTMVVLVGDYVCPLENRLKELRDRRRLDDGHPFPHQLLAILPLTDKQLAQGVSKWSALLERSLNRVNDALVISQISRERGLSIAYPLWLYLVACSCDKTGSAHLKAVLELFHRICRANQLLYQVHAFILLPGLLEDREDLDPQLLRARALVTLSQLQYVMSQRSGLQWEDNTPLHTIWLVDARNERGEFVGYLHQALDMISQMILGSATGDLEVLYPQGGSSVAEERFFSSFGYMQLELPLKSLERWLAEQFVTYVLKGQVLRRERIDSNEVLLAVKQFCHDERLTPQGLLTRVETRPDGSALLTPFVADIEEALPPVAYVEALEHQVRAYEDGPAWLQAKRALHHRSQEVLKELIALVHTKIGEIVDTHPSGIFYAQAFLEELVGKGESSQLVEGPRLDMPTNLQSRRQELLERLFDDLGVPKYRQELRQVEVQLAHCNEEIQLCEIQLRGYEEADSPPHKKAEIAAQEALHAKLQQLHEEKQRLEAQRQKLRDILSLTNRDELRQRIEEERRSQLKEAEEALCRDGQELQVTKQELTHLLEQRPHLVRRYFVHYPIALGAGIVVALLVLILSRLTPLTKVLLTPLTWQFSLVLIGGYFLWALWRFYQRFILKQRELDERIRTLEQRIAAGKLALRDGYYQLFHDLFIQHRDNVALTCIQDLIEYCEDKLKQLKEFCKALQQQSCDEDKPSFQPEDSLTHIALLRPEHYRILFESLVEEDLDREARRCLNPNYGGVRLSSLADAGAPGAQTLFDALRDWGQRLVQRKLSGLGVEELLWAEPFAQLRSRLKLAPDGIIRLLTSVASAIQIQDSAGAGTTQYQAIGVPDVQRSWLREQLAGRNCVLFSHYDPSRLIAFCVTGRFSLGALSQLNFYQEAFKAVWQRRKEELQLPEAQIQSLLPYMGFEDVFPIDQSALPRRRSKVREE